MADVKLDFVEFLLGLKEVVWGAAWHKDADSKANVAFCPEALDRKIFLRVVRDRLLNSLYSFSVISEG
jgi:hypothetical protein